MNTPPMLLRPIAAAIGWMLLGLALEGCSATPPLCIRTARWEDGATRTLMAGARMPMRAGLLDILEECDRPATTPVVWSSSMPAVAGVDSTGMVHALSPGTADVVARSGEVEARYPVTVVPRVARIEIMPAETTLTAGDTARYRATAYGVDGGALPAVRLVMRATEAPVSYREHRTVPALAELVPYRANVAAAPPGGGELHVYGRRRAWGHVVASLIGRADSVVVRVVERPASQPSAP